MVTASVHEAKTHLSRYLSLASGGEDVIIMRRGQPVARLVSMNPLQEERRGGRLRGQFNVPDDFDAPHEDIGRDFES